MPPPLSEDEASELGIEEEVEVPPKKATKKKLSKALDEPIEESVDDEEVSNRNTEEDEDEAAEGEYAVEAIKSHLVDDTGILFQVKWEGYEKRSDMTWEPEDSLLGSADEILNEYLESVGGRDHILAEAMREKEQKTKKRGRAPTVTTASDKSNGKRSRKNNSHPASTTPPASLTNSAFKPPSGSWEDDVQSIDACEGTDGSVMVFLQWASGHRTQHPLEVVYKRCPQKMLKFYEAHLSFTSAVSTSELSADVVIASSKRPRGRPRKGKT